MTRFSSKFAIENVDRQLTQSIDSALVKLNGHHGDYGNASIHKGAVL